MAEQPQPQQSDGEDTVTYARAEGGPSSVFLRMKIEALNRVAAELRGMLADAPKDDPVVAALLRDCALIEQVANEMTVAIPVSSLGVSVQSINLRADAQTGNEAAS